MDIISLTYIVSDYRYTSAVKTYFNRRLRVRKEVERGEKEGEWGEKEGERGEKRGRTW